MSKLIRPNFHTVFPAIKEFLEHLKKVIICMSHKTAYCNGNDVINILYVRNVRIFVMCKNNVN